MALTRLTRGVLLLPVFLVAISLFFNSVAALTGAAAILFALLWRYAVFQIDVTRVLASSRIERGTEKSIVRQGGSIRVHARFTFDPRASVRAEVTEILPKGGRLYEGSVGPVFAANGECTLEYAVEYQVHGDLKFPGLQLSLCDRFFSDRYLLTSPHFQGPVVAVQPMGEFESSFGVHGYGEEEIAKIRAITGLGVRGFREFNLGDDMRHIDWKLSAKYDRLMLREYTMLGGSYPLLILDLPESRGSGESEKGFDELVQAVTGALDRSLREFRRATLLLISGPNIVRMYPEESRFLDVMEVIRREVHPVPRQRTLYRFETKPELKARAREAEIQALRAKERDEKDFLAGIAGIYHSIADTGEIHAFQGEIARMLRIMPHDDVLLFSLCRGDTSHIRILVDQMHRRSKEVRLHVPDCPGGPDIRAFKGSFKVDRIEVIPCR